MCAALALTLWGLFQLDVPLARWIQNIDEPWFEMVGRVGQGLGDWRSLLGISGIVLLLGALRRDASLRQTGVATLLAHGYAALAVQLLKHLIGRSRPRLTHGSSLIIGPNFDSGFDSFPSGHTTASIAIAMVLARRFPRYGWVAYGVAGVIAVSRVIKGSHFPGDVLAAVCVGSMVGSLAAQPVQMWRESLLNGFRATAPWLIGIGAAILLLFQTPRSGPVSTLLPVAGGVLVAAGLGGRWSGVLAARWAVPLLGLGLALTAGSWLIAALAAMAMAAITLDGTLTEPVPPWDRNGLAREVVLLLGVGLLAVAIHGMKGWRPLL
jgi:undecaprenyl-diphosphatase